MGNRAVITFHTNPKGPAVYVHWNGGLASVLGFLAAQRELFSWDTSHDLAERTWQLHKVCQAYLGSSAYLEPELGVTDQDNWDNGTYVVDPTTLLIRQRLHTRGAEEVNQAKTIEIAQHCVQAITSDRCSAWFDLLPVLPPKGRAAKVRAPKGARKALVGLASQERDNCLAWFALCQDRIDQHGRLLTPAAAALNTWARDHLVVVRVGDAA